MKPDNALARVRAWFTSSDARAVTRAEVAQRFGISAQYATRVLSILRYERVITMRRRQQAEAVYERAAP